MRRSCSNGPPSPVLAKPSYAWSRGRVGEGGVLNTSRVKKMPNKHARHLRTHQTLAERSLWEILRNRQIVGHRFRRQHPIGPFIADFVCLERRVIIEADGDVHDNPARRSNDIQRDHWLSTQRFRILRLSNEVIMTDPELTLSRIQTFLGCTPDRIVHHPHPDPPPSRGREK